jgi:hypothetical protein
MLKLAYVILATLIPFQAYADEISKAEEILHSPQYKCQPYLHFQKPGAELYNYFTLTVCISQDSKSITYLLTNNCADTVYWTDLAARKYNGSVYSNAKNDTPGPYVLPILFHLENGPLSVKIKPGETSLPPFEQFESIRSDPMSPMLPIEAYSIDEPYATIAMTFAGNTVNFNEVFVAVLAEN